MHIIAHRGGNTESFQENSYEIVENFFKYNREFKRKYSGIEIDITETKYGDLLLMHGEYESERLTGKKINLLSMKRDDILKYKISKYIKKAHEYDKDKTYYHEGTFTFLDTVFELYKLYGLNDIIFVLDIKTITQKGCRKLNNLLLQYNIPFSNIKLCGFGLFTSYYLNKYFPHIYKEWFIILDKYSQFPSFLNKLYNKIMYKCLKNWNGLSIAFYDNSTLNEQIIFIRKNNLLSLFGLNSNQLNAIINNYEHNFKYTISYICVDTEEY